VAPGAAVSAARAADDQHGHVGESQALSGEASSRSDLNLPGRQQELVQAVAATGRPYVVVLMNGRPLTVNWLAENAPAVLEAWFGGTEAGNAVADVLFGKVNPSAKLPVSFPRNVGQIPVYYNHRNTGRPEDPNNKYTSKYLDVPNSPLYPFGFGLSYTTFALSDLALSSASVPSRGVLRVTATLTNTGSGAGTDVLQVYLHDKVASITQPVRRLAGFQRVTLQPGQSRRVTFRLNSSDFGFYDNSARFRVEPGGFEVFVGDSSVGGLRGEFTVTR
jgi:beta-glucosidase